MVTDIAGLFHSFTSILLTENLRNTLTLVEFCIRAPVLLLPSVL